MCKSTVVQLYGSYMFDCIKTAKQFFQNALNHFTFLPAMY